MPTSRYFRATLVGAAAALFVSVVSAGYVVERGDTLAEIAVAHAADHPRVRDTLTMASYLDDGHPFPERTHLSVLFATFQIEMFKAIERWIQFARDEIDEWPTTQDLGMTPRTEALTRLLAEDQSPVNR